MADKPIFILDNWISIESAFLTTTVAGDSGFGLEKVYDNLHYTYYKKSGLNGTVDFKINPDEIIPAVDCVIIDCVDRIVCTQVAVFIKPDGINEFVKFDKIMVLEKGPNLIRFSELPVWDGPDHFILRIATNYAQDLKIRHIVLGKGFELIDQPVAPFDPLRDSQTFDKIDSENGFVIQNSIRTTKNILEATFDHIASTDVDVFHKLKEKCWRKAQPFWFFFRPDSKPTEGGLFYLDFDEYNYGFTSGTDRQISIRAVGDVSPDRTVTADFGYLQRALLFNSTDNASLAADLTVGTQFSIEAWVSFAALADRMPFISGDFGVHEFGLLVSPENRLYLEVSGSGQAAVGVVVSTSTAYHCVVTRSGTTVRFYLDGAYQGANDTELSSNNDSVFDLVGQEAGVSQLTMNGKIAIIRIFNRALTDTEVTELYNSGKGNSFLKNITIRSWEMREGTGTTVDDEVLPADTSRRLTLSGTAWANFP